MGVKITTPAALNGEVRTIPLIDKTLTIEGACADAKATGDRFGAQAAIIEENARANAEAVADINSRLSDAYDDINQNHRMIMDDVKPELAEAKNDIVNLRNSAEDLRHEFDKTSGNAQHYYNLLEHNESTYDVSCGVCTVWLDFFTLTEITSETALLEDLPAPKTEGRFLVYNASTGQTHVLRLERYGRIFQEDVALPGPDHYVGNVSYVVL